MLPHRLGTVSADGASHEPNSEDDGSDDSYIGWNFGGTSVSSEMDTYMRSKTPPPYVNLRGRTLKVIVKLANIVLRSLIMMVARGM